MAQCYKISHLPCRSRLDCRECKRELRSLKWLSRFKLTWAFLKKKRVVIPCRRTGAVALRVGRRAREWIWRTDTNQTSSLHFSIKLTLIEPFIYSSCGGGFHLQSFSHRVKNEIKLKLRSSGRSRIADPEINGLLFRLEK